MRNNDFLILVFILVGTIVFTISMITIAIIDSAVSHGTVIESKGHCKKCETIHLRNIERRY